LDGLKKSIEGIAKRKNYGLNLEDLKDETLPDALSSIPNVSIRTLSISIKPSSGTDRGLGSVHRVCNSGFGKLMKIDSRIY